MKRFLKFLTPKFILTAYHRTLVFLAALWYGFPSQKMVVIGVTGTKGKSTTSILIGRIFQQQGFNVGITSTALFKIADREWLNGTKMTMLGRFALQKMLRSMVRAGCSHAVVEVSSEGLAQHRHRGIEFDIAVFTNLSPEHIESHGSFEKYREAKGELFRALGTKRKKIKGERIPTISIINLDDPNAEYFLQFPANKKYGYTFHDGNHTGLTHTVKGHTKEAAWKQSTFVAENTPITIHLPGEFNLYNALAALAVGSSCGIPIATMSAALGAVDMIWGRMETIHEGQPFTVIVDYAHEPRSFKALYEAITLLPHTRVIHVFGATGGGRDKSKRVLMGCIASERADTVIVTTDDPYDEEPGAIADMVMEGVGDGKGKIILDRKEAIAYALTLAQPQDLVLITGKGAEQVMVVQGKKIPWDDRKIVRQLLKSNHASINKN